MFGDDVYSVHGSAFEVKVKDQCFYNMFGSGTRLATMALKLGKIVNKVSMFGVVSVTKDQEY